jgi:hypothetical protein
MSTPGDSAGTGATVSPWRRAGPELVIAGVVIVAGAAVGYVLAGWAGLSVAVTAGAAAAIVVLRYLLPALTPDAARKAREKPQARLLSGYSHRRSVVHNAIASRGFYQGELRPLLEHLLAARLAERHGVHLYQDPDAARRLLCRRPRDADLWPWIEPTLEIPEGAQAPEGARPRARASKASTEPGIPRRTLACLIDRLERL